MGRFFKKAKHARKIRSADSALDPFVERALDIRKNQFSNWSTLQDIREDENMLNLREQMWMSDESWMEGTRRVWEAITYGAKRASRKKASDDLSNLSIEELHEMAIRDNLKHEQQAIMVYSKYINALPQGDPIRKGLEDIRKEEREHSGELYQLLFQTSAEEVFDFEEGKGEVMKEGGRVHRAQAVPPAGSYKLLDESDGKVYYAIITEDPGAGYRLNVYDAWGDEMFVEYGYSSEQSALESARVWANSSTAYRTSGKSGKRKTANEIAQTVLDTKDGFISCKLVERENGKVAVQFKGVESPWIAGSYYVEDFTNHSGELYTDYGAGISISGETVREIRLWIKDEMSASGRSTMAKNKKAVAIPDDLQFLQFPAGGVDDAYMAEIGPYRVEIILQGNEWRSSVIDNQSTSDEELFVGTPQMDFDESADQSLDWIVKQGKRAHRSMKKQSDYMDKLVKTHPDFDEYECNVLNEETDQRGEAEVFEASGGWYSFEVYVDGEEVAWSEKEHVSLEGAIDELISSGWQIVGNRNIHHQKKSSTIKKAAPYIHITSQDSTLVAEYGDDSASVYKELPETFGEIPSELSYGTSIEIDPMDVEEFDLKPDNPDLGWAVLDYLDQLIEDGVLASRKQADDWDYQFSDEGPYAVKEEGGLEAYYALEPNADGEYDWNVYNVEVEDVLAYGAESTEEAAKSKAEEGLKSYQFLASKKVKQAGSLAWEDISSMMGGEAWVAPVDDDHEIMVTSEEDTGFPGFTVCYAEIFGGIIEWIGGRDNPASFETAEEAKQAAEDWHPEALMKTWKRSKSMKSAKRANKVARSIIATMDVDEFAADIKNDMYSDGPWETEDEAREALMDMIEGKVLYDDDIFSLAQEYLDAQDVLKEFWDELVEDVMDRIGDIRDFVEYGEDE